MLIDNEVAQRVVDAFNESNDIIGFVNSARMQGEDCIVSDIEGSERNYSVASFLYALDDVLNDDDYEDFADAFYEIIEKYVFKNLILSLKRGF